MQVQTAVKSRCQKLEPPKKKKAVAGVHGIKSRRGSQKQTLCESIIMFPSQAIPQPLKHLWLRGGDKNNTEEGTCTNIQRDSTLYGAGECSSGMRYSTSDGTRTCTRLKCQRNCAPWMDKYFWHGQK